jgi:hypothetical protein
MYSNVSFFRSEDLKNFWKKVEISKNWGEFE